MIFELNKAEYKNVSGILNPGYLSVQLQSVINGTNPGLIYADSVESPQTAIIFHQGESGCYFIGNPYNAFFMDELIPFIRTTLAERLNKLRINTFDFSGDSTDWDVEFRRIFRPENYWESTQRIYLSEDPVPVSCPVMPDGCTLHRLTAETAESGYLSNFAFIKKKIDHWFFSWEDFIRQGGGFYAKRGDRLVGRCLIDGRIDSIVAVGIAVEREFRNNGIASALAAEMVNSIVNNGHIPYWECADDNLPSIRLAERCGLNLKLTYQLFGFDL